MSGASGQDDGAQVDVEAAWAQIVEHWDDDVTTGETAADLRLEADGLDAAALDPVEGADDVADDVRPSGDGAAPSPDSRRSRRVVRPAEDSDLEDWPTPPVAGGADDDWDAATSRVGGQRAADAGRRSDDVEDALDAEGYVPDEPPPLPRGDLVSWLAWAGVLGAPLFLLLAALFWRSAPSLVIATAVVAFVAGFGTLVLRLPAHRDDDPDDGAVV